MLQKGTLPNEAVNIISRGIQKSTGRIFISDGKWQDRLARALPTSYVNVVGAVMKLKGIEQK